MEETEFTKHFNLHDGTRLADINELMHSLNSMEQQVFNHHVTPERNDFSMWINDVFGEHDLAKQIVRCKSREELFLHLVNFKEEKELKTLRKQMDSFLSLIN